MPIDIAPQNVAGDAGLPEGSDPIPQASGEVPGDLFDTMFSAPGELPGYDPSASDMVHWPNAFPNAQRVAGTPEPAEPQAPAPNQPVPDKDNPDRYQFWQSRHDLLNRELALTKQELESRKQLDPVLELVRRDPETYQYLMAKINQQQPQVPQGPPKPPEPPAVYNEAEAYTNPESPSWAHRKALEKYNSERLEYVQAQVGQREKEIQEFREREMRAEQSRKQVAEVFRELDKHGLSETEKREFISWSNSPESLTVKNLVSLYKLSKGMAQQSQQSMPQPQQKRQVPPPPSSGTNQFPVSRPDETQLLNQAIKGWGVKAPLIDFRNKS